VDDVQYAYGGVVEHLILSLIVDQAVVEEVDTVDLQAATDALGNAGSLVVVPSERALNLMPVGVQDSF
jgi:hypothetical protein